MTSVIETAGFPDDGKTVRRGSRARAVVRPARRAAELAAVTRLRRAPSGHERPDGRTAVPNHSHTMGLTCGDAPSHGVPAGSRRLREGGVASRRGPSPASAAECGQDGA